MTPPASPCPRASTRRWPASCSTSSAASRRWATASRSTTTAWRWLRWTACGSPPCSSPRSNPCPTVPPRIRRRSGPLNGWSALAVATSMLVVNGVFVALEFSLVASRRTKLEELAAGGSLAAGRALDASGDLSLQLAGAQLGITMASLDPGSGGRAGHGPPAAAGGRGRGPVGARPAPWPASWVCRSWCSCTWWWASSCPRTWPWPRPNGRCAGCRRPTPATCSSSVP